MLYKKIRLTFWINRSTALLASFLINNQNMQKLFSLLMESHYKTYYYYYYVTLVVSDSVRPHRRQPTRLPRPWDSAGKNTGMGCHFLLQRMKVKSESEVAQSCPTLRDPMDCGLPGSSFHGIFQARVLEWIAIALSV